MATHKGLNPCLRRYLYKSMKTKVAVFCREHSISTEFICSCEDCLWVLCGNVAQRVRGITRGAPAVTSSDITQCCNRVCVALCSSRYDLIGMAPYWHWVSVQILFHSHIFNLLTELYSRARYRRSATRQEQKLCPKWCLHRQPNRGERWSCIVHGSSVV